MMRHGPRVVGVPMMSRAAGVVRPSAVDARVRVVCRACIVGPGCGRGSRPRGLPCLHWNSKGDAGLDVEHSPRADNGIHVPRPLRVLLQRQARVQAYQAGGHGVLYVSWQ